MEKETLITIIQEIEPIITAIQGIVLIIITLKKNYTEEQNQIREKYRTLLSRQEKCKTYIEDNTHEFLWSEKLIEVLTDNTELGNKLAIDKEPCMIQDNREIFDKAQKEIREYSIKSSTCFKNGKKLSNYFTKYADLLQEICAYRQILMVYSNSCKRNQQFAVGKQNPSPLEEVQGAQDKQHKKVIQLYKELRKTSRSIHLLTILGFSVE